VWRFADRASSTTSNFLSYAYKKEKLSWPFSYRMLELHSISQYAFMILENNGKKVPRSLSLENVARYFGFEREGEYTQCAGGFKAYGKVLYRFV